MKKIYLKLMALALLSVLSVTNAWAYVIIRNAELAGSTGDWSNSDAMTQVGTSNVYYKTYDSPKPADDDLKFRIGTGSGWTTEKNSDGIDNLNSNVVMRPCGDDDKNIKFRIPASVPVTIYYNSSTRKIWIKVDSYKVDVLNGKEMFYYGATKGWGDYVYFFDNGTRKFGSHATDTYTDGVNLAIGVYDVNGSTSYSASHNSGWAGISHTGMAAGCRIYTYNSSGDKCSYTTASTFSFGSTAYSIAAGQTIASFPSISFTSKTSGVGSSLSLEGYYYSTATSGQTWTAFTPGTTESSLAVGTYYIKAIATDGAIYMASTNYITLTVTSSTSWDLYNSSTKLGTFTQDDDYEYSLTVDMSTSYTSLKFWKDGTTGYIPSTGDPTSSNQTISTSASTFSWANVSGVTNGTYKLTIKSDNSGSSWYYKAERVYQVVYNDNDATGGSAPATVNYSVGDYVTTAAQGTLAKEYYTFDGWNTEPDGTGTHYNASTSNAFQISSSSVTLYAEWRPNLPNSNVLKIDGPLFSDWDNCQTMTSVIGTNRKTYTYSGLVGTVSNKEFVFKHNGCNDFLKAKSHIMSLVTTTGCTVGTTGSSNYNFTVTTTSPGWVTVTVVLGTTDHSSYPNEISIDVTREDLDYAYYLKHPWDGGTWEWRPVTNETGTYYIRRDKYGNDGCNYFKASDGSSGWVSSPTKHYTSSISTHDSCLFVYNSSNNAIDIYKLYPVTFNVNSATSGRAPGAAAAVTNGTVNFPYGRATTIPSNAGSLAKSGYSFDGWNTANNGSGTNYTAGSSTLSMSSSSKTLYARWKATITLDANSGSAANGSARTYFNSTSKLTFVTAITPYTGYHITGYYAEPEGTTLIAATDGTLVSNKSGFTDSSGKWTATEAKTLYPQYSNEYTVTFNQHDPSFEGTDEVTATYGEAMPPITVPSKTGYTFGGYYSGTNGSGTKYYEANGESARTWNLTSDTELHAQWTGISYQVAFDANEGTGSMANEDFTYGAAAKALTSNTFTRSGYYFLGWNSSADGSGTQYYNGKSVQNLTTTDGGIVTLYAQWAKTYTLYFVQADCDWNPPYAKAQISYDGQTYYPLTGSNEWSAMTADGTVYLTHIEYNSSHYFNVFKIANVPEGSSIDFSSNSSGSSAVGYMSWVPEKPYFVYGNRTWYALDIEDPRTISKATNMVVHMGDGSEYGIDQHGDEEYALVELSGNTEYRFKYYNWLSNSWSGCTASEKDDAFIINEKTTTGVGGPWSLNGEAGGYDVYLYTTVDGEYKFKLTWVSTTPQTTVYYPVGVSLARSPEVALAGATTTVRLTATPAKTYLMTSPTYYYQMSTDNGKTWTTIAETSSTTYDYTFAAQKCKFRVILKNDAGLRSKSSELSFTTYSTKSFYVYNPYNNSTNNWRWLHLYTWDSNDGNRTYNGDFPTGSAENDCGYIQGVDNAEPQNCRNGNNLAYVGNDWFYITIDERANCFMLVGESPYNSHQTITCYVNNYIANGKYMIYTENNQNKVVAYQAKGASDYRLKYTYGSPAKYRYSPIYNTTLDGATVTTSMWMNASDAYASVAIEQGTGNNTWSVRKTYSNDGSDGFDGLVGSSYRANGYVFQMQINFNTGTPTSSTISNVAVSSGPFYVRTDGLEGGWTVYKTDKHRMHHSVASLTSGSPAYDYYLCKWIGSAETNVKFTIADDYNPELVESLEGDVSSTEALYNRQTIPTATNVRFSWNSRTNTLTRAYLSGSTDEASRYLVLVETSETKGKIYKEDGTVPTNNELFFSDLGNWVYQIIMTANPGAEAKVTAKYNTKEAEFIPSNALIGGTGSSKYTYRIIYDFKTNMLTNAWVPDGKDITSEIQLNTNVMIIRNGQDAGIQIHFTGDGRVIYAKKLLGVMEFEYNKMVGKMGSWNTTAYEYCMYYISFPYDVKVSDIFGVGEMGIDWRLQYYDGAERASKGFFRGDGTKTFWKDVPADGTLKANVGYSLLLNRVKFNNNMSDLWENKTSGSKLYLYFPSEKSFENDSIIASGTKTIQVPSHTCTIDRTFETPSGTVNHKFTDSHWNMIGVPLFENQSNVETEKFVTTKDDQVTPFETDKGYFYEWTPSTNSMAVRTTSGYQFKSMHGYMVQFTGSVGFSGSSLQEIPAGIVARRNVQTTENYTLELELLRENEHTSRTYVELREEACDTFALNEDMYMLYTSLPADLYTMAGGYDVSANVLSINDHIIPVGIEVHNAGTYTFTMPSNFSGEVVLVDTYTQTRTNLMLEDYEIALPKGMITDRFYLELSINKMPTAIDGVEGGSLKDGKAHKFIENGQMYILQNGVIYDAQGKRVK